MQPRLTQDMAKIMRFIELNVLDHERTLADVMHLYYLRIATPTGSARRALNNELTPKIYRKFVLHVVFD